MSNEQSQSPATSRFRSTFQSASYSFSSTSVNGTTMSQSEATYSDPTGTKVYRKTQNPGAAPREERLEYDRSGRELQDAGVGTAGAIEGRVEDVTDVEEQRERDRQYEENMENEYAKREGGA